MSKFISDMEKMKVKDDKLKLIEVDHLIDELNDVFPYGVPSVITEIIEKQTIIEPDFDIDKDNIETYYLKRQINKAIDAAYQKGFDRGVIFTESCYKGKEDELQEEDRGSEETKETSG